jgi:muramoyltetrapeptide carboxypeptidase
MIKYPPYLKRGNTIGITCPAGYMAAAKAKDCISTLQQWGFDVMVGKTLGSSSKNYFSGSDEERIHELQAMLDDPNIHAIVFGRGGYGMSRIIDRLNFKKFVKHPKWLVGFSDITLLHAHLISQYCISSIHGPMAGAFAQGSKTKASIQSLHETLLGKKLSYSSKPNSLNRMGAAKGMLVGGNLTLLTHAMGSSSELDTRNKILFIEDIGEYRYQIDRMMQQLKRSGKLKGLLGLVVGGFTEMKDTERPFGKSIAQIIHESVQEYSFPVCFDFPVSHSSQNVALKMGGDYELKVSSRSVRLREG